MGAQFSTNIFSPAVSADILATTSLTGDNTQFIYEDITLSDEEYNSTYEFTNVDVVQSGATLDAISSNVLLEPDNFIVIDPPGTIVGQNVDDNETSITEYAVGQGSGSIDGLNSADKLIGDFGGSTVINQTQSYNVVFILDVSGSMQSTSVTGESRLDLMVRSVNELMASFNGFEGGDVRVHITAFNAQGAASGSFLVTNDTGFHAAMALTNGLVHGGATNYEAGLQGAIDWLQNGDAITNATTTTYFLSDGMPNRVINDANGDAVNVDAATAMAEILGSDGSNDVQLIQSLSDEVIGVGINITDDNIFNIELIDSDGHALNVPADKLVATMQETNPMLKLASVGDDVINGNGGNDIIFGDSLNTDILALTHGLSTVSGDGWEVFVQLEAGQSTINSSWGRSNTLSYISNNILELSQEVINDDGTGRIGGNDILNGGDNNDWIFGQEGDDIITGGLGNDILYGGSGTDIFNFDLLNERGDTIRDFDLSEGDAIDIADLLFDYDIGVDNVLDHLSFVESGNNTQLFFHETGINNTNGLAITTLENIIDANIQEYIDNGNLIV